MPNSDPKNSLPQLLLMLVVFIGLFFAVKFIWALTMAVMKWVLIGGIALILTGFAVKRINHKDS